MAKIVLSTIGSLGDLHPKLALGIELRRRGHHVVINSWEGYAEKVAMLGLDFAPLRPSHDPFDRELMREAMDAWKGPETIIRRMLFPYLREMYEDVIAACEGADILVSGEIVFVARSVMEKTGIKWISTSLAPFSMFSSHDPNVFPTAEWMDVFRPLPTGFHRGLFGLMRLTIRHWYEPYKEFRRELGLDPAPDPVFEGKYSDRLHLAMFSKVLMKPQPDWFSPTMQTGFCFYDGEQDLGQMQPALEDFLASGKPPIVFTLGSAAVMDPRDFFDESIKAAKLLRRRAVLAYGIFNEPPKGLTDDIVGFEYVPYSRLFPRAACVVHQGGVGTTAHVLRAGVPHLIMPYSHDQPDNAARCRRLGVAEVISRGRYKAETAASAISRILDSLSYAAIAKRAAAIIATEDGIKSACDAIEAQL